MRSSDSHPWLRGAILETGDEDQEEVLPLVVQSPERSKKPDQLSGELVGYLQSNAWEGLELTSLA